MTAGPYFAETAALIGDPARANMLAALMDGRALTATELAHVAGVSAPTASEHLAKLGAGGLLEVARQGRHRYFRLAAPEVARAIEALMVLTSTQAPLRHRPPARLDERLRAARTCYDHFAGRLGVAIADALVARGHLTLEADAGRVSDAGREALQRFGLDLSALSARRRPFCRPCLDWSERRPHLAGALGAAIARRCFDQDWARRDRDSRAVIITPAGRKALAEGLGVGV